MDRQTDGSAITQEMLAEFCRAVTPSPAAHMFESDPLSSGEEELLP